MEWDPDLRPSCPILETTTKSDDLGLERRNITEHIRDIQTQDRVLADFLPQMVWIVRSDDRLLLYGNLRFHDYLGVAASDWASRSVIFHEDDRYIVERAFDAVRRDGIAPEEEVRIRDRSGRFRWHKIMLASITAGGEIVEWIVTALDIDEMVASRIRLQEATDLFSLAQEAAGAGTWDLDLQNSGVNLSRESARLHGLDDAAAVLDLERWATIVDAGDAKMVIETLQKAVDDRSIFNGEFRVRSADGTRRWLSGIGRAYYDAAGEPVRMIGLNFDITERKCFEESLLAAKTEAERASTAKSDFLASMSHEIRTPLNSIIGYTDLLMEEADHGSAVRRKLEVIQEAGSALLTVVNDILDFSKIEAGQVELDPVAFSPRALVENVVSMLSGQAHRKRLAITKYISLNVPYFVSGDENRIRQILLNLVTNAVKFTDAGRIAINVERGPRGADAVETIRFSVRDTGIGISFEQQQRLFQRFSQVDGSISRKYGGTGLGLAICKQLVDLMGGEIGVESLEGDGSRFWFVVPLPPADSPDVHETSIQPDSVKSAKILLVEDVDVNQDLARAVLERAGYVVDVASNGAEAVERVRTDDYDVVLMDVQMPVMDGMIATKEIRALDGAKRKVPIIAMTANVLPQQVAGLKAAGMDDHVGKPFRRPELLSAIERWTGGGSVSRSDVVPAGRSEPRCDADTFHGLEEMIGEASFRMSAAKLSMELANRFQDLGADADRERLAEEAHVIIQPVGLFGFVRLLKIFKRLNEGVSRDEWADRLRHDLEAERKLVLEDLDRYLGTAGATSRSPRQAST